MTQARDASEGFQTPSECSDENVWLSMYDESQRLRKAGKLSEAAQILRQLSELDPDEPLFHWNIGYIYLDAGKTREAITHFKKALSLSQDCIAAWGGLGHAYTATREYDLAEAAFRQRLAIEKSDNHYVFLAYTLYMQCNYEDAIACCQQALDMNPLQEEAYLNMAKALEKLGRLDEARKALASAIKVNPRNALAYAELAYLHLLLGESTMAAEEIRKSLDLDPNIPVSYAFAYNIFQLIGHDREASEALDRLRDM